MKPGRLTALLLGGIGGLFGACLIWLAAPGPVRTDLIDEPRLRAAVSNLVRRTDPGLSVQLDAFASHDTVAACLLWRDGANNVVPRELRPRNAAWSAAWLATIPNSDEVLLVFLSAEGFQTVSFPTSYVFRLPEPGHECGRLQGLAIERRQGHLAVAATTQDRSP